MGRIIHHKSRFLGLRFLFFYFNIYRKNYSAQEKTGDEALKNIEKGYVFGAGNVVGTTLDAAADIGTMRVMVWTGPVGVGAVLGLIAG